MYAQRTSPFLERRMVPDRRKRPTSCWRTLRLRGRRRGFRRVGEGPGGFVDHPAPFFIVLVLWVTVGSALDALFTLLHIANGGGEANPFMVLALTHGNTIFVGCKMGMTCAGTWLLSILQHFPLTLVVLHVLTLVYLGIIGLHAVMLLP